MIFMLLAVRVAAVHRWHTIATARPCYVIGPRAGQLVQKEIVPPAPSQHLPQARNG